MILLPSLICLQLIWIKLSISRTLKIGFYSYFLRNKNKAFQIGQNQVQHKNILQTHENCVYIKTLFMTCTKAFGNGKLYNIAQQENVTFRSYIHHKVFYYLLHFFYKGIYWLLTFSSPL